MTFVRQRKDILINDGVCVCLLTDALTLQFRVEAFNIWNHTQFNPPAGQDMNTPATFGKTTSTSVTPRVMQFGLKLLF